ncbi:MAG: IPTL-CTERM sorting domain-containing protein [Casimicrobiaceae bacterium]
MQSHLVRQLAAFVFVVAVALAGAAPREASAARVAVLSNFYQNETAAALAARISGHTFTPIDVSVSVPALAELTARYDVLLLFEDSTFGNAPAVGNVVAAYARTGRAVVLGTFYDQDRSDKAPTVTLTPHGWGALETIDPNTTDGTGTAYSLRSLDAASVVAHPLTAGVTALFGNRFAGGNQPKAGTRVLANWAQKNARGGADPAIAYRFSEGACVIHIAIAPQYPVIDTTNTEFGGDFYRVWANAFDFGASNCASGITDVSAVKQPTAIPTLSAAGLAVMALLLAALAALPRVRARRR